MRTTVGFALAITLLIAGCDSGAAGGGADAAADAAVPSDAADPADAADPPDQAAANRYETGFEGASCPGGWTLAGDWECGVPMNVGPSSAFEGTQCLATRIARNYSPLQTWGQTTATSPEISLVGAVNPTLSFRMWVDTEGVIYDGAHVEISTDGGATYNVISSVTPAYMLVIAGQSAWGGRLAASGWQAVQVDLSAYAGKSIRLRFAFQSDSSGTLPGVYIDSILVT